jgi:hypothetical protein
MTSIEDMIKLVDEAATTLLALSVLRWRTNDINPKLITIKDGFDIEVSLDVFWALHLVLHDVSTWKYCQFYKC